RQVFGPRRPRVAALGQFPSVGANVTMTPVVTATTRATQVLSKSTLKQLKTGRDVLSRIGRSRPTDASDVAGRGQRGRSSVYCPSEPADSADQGEQHVAANQRAQGRREGRGAAERG